MKTRIMLTISRSNSMRFFVVLLSNSWTFDTEQQRVSEHSPNLINVSLQFTHFNMNGNRQFVKQWVCPNFPGFGETALWDCLTWEGLMKHFSILSKKSDFQKDFKWTTFILGEALMLPKHAVFPGFLLIGIQGVCEYYDLV